MSTGVVYYRKSYETIRKQVIEHFKEYITGPRCNDSGNNIENNGNGGAE
jgi:hypothetical protein